MLEDLRAALDAGGDLCELARGLVAAKEDGRIKLYVTERVLHCRRDHPGLLSAPASISRYRPSAPKAAHVFAFARCAVISLPLSLRRRLIARLVGDRASTPLGEAVWEDTRLDLSELDPGLRWRNIFTGELLAAVDRGGQSR